MAKSILTIEGFKQYSIDRLTDEMNDTAQRYTNCDVDIKYQLHYEPDGTEFYTGILIVKDLD